MFRAPVRSRTSGDGGLGFKQLTHQVFGGLGVTTLQRQGQFFQDLPPESILPFNNPFCHMFVFVMGRSYLFKFQKKHMQHILICSCSVYIFTYIWLKLSYFHPYLRKIPILTIFILTIFQRGWFNHRTARRDLALLRHSIQIRLDALRVPWVALVSGEIRNKNIYPPSTEAYNPSFFGGLFSHPYS